jgi:phosphoglycolate phosphatase
LASEAAGTRTVIALYGYIQDTDQPLSWPAEAYIKEPIELMKWL